MTYFTCVQCVIVLSCCVSNASSVSWLECDPLLWIVDDGCSVHYKYPMKAMFHSLLLFVFISYQYLCVWNLFHILYNIIYKYKYDILVVILGVSDGLHGSTYIAAQHIHRGGLEVPSRTGTIRFWSWTLMHSVFKEFLYMLLIR